MFTINKSLFLFTYMYLMQLCNSFHAYIVHTCIYIVDTCIQVLVYKVLFLSSTEMGEVSYNVYSSLGKSVLSLHITKRHQKESVYVHVCLRVGKNKHVAVYMYVYTFPDFSCLWRLRGENLLSERDR